MKKVNSAKDTMSIGGVWSYIILVSVGFMAVPFFIISSADGDETKIFIGNTLLALWGVGVTGLIIIGFLKKKK